MQCFAKIVILGCYICIESHTWNVKILRVANFNALICKVEVHILHNLNEICVSIKDSKKHHAFSVFITTRKLISLSLLLKCLNTYSNSKVSKCLSQSRLQASL